MDDNNWPGVDIGVIAISIVASAGSARTMAVQLTVMRATPRHAEELISGDRVPQSSPSVKANVSREFRKPQTRRPSRTQGKAIGRSGTRCNAFRKGSPSVRTNVTDLIH